MASEKVVRIMRSKGAPFTDEQLEAMSDRAGWRWIYASARKARETRDDQVKICLTGFRPAEKTIMASFAEQHGFKVVTKVTEQLDYLITGKTPGPAKIKEAEAMGAEVLDAETFHEMCVDDPEDSRDQ